MLGHVAQSIGGALPGIGGGASALVSQHLLNEAGTTAVTVPNGATFAFVELLGAGGAAQSSNSQYIRGGGGAGNDRLLEVAEGGSFEVVLSDISTSPSASIARYNGAQVLTAASASSASGSPNFGATGKYGGQRSESGGRGGGRLAGRTAQDTAQEGRAAAGYGSGGLNRTTLWQHGGPPAACITFFRNREAAVAFANSLYNGAWVPS